MEEEEKIKILADNGVPKKFAQWAISYLKASGFDYQTADISAYYDRVLTWAENKQIIKNQYPSSSSEKVASHTAMELEHKVQRKAQLEEYITSLHEQEEKALKEIAENKDEGVMKKHTNTLKALVSNVAEGFSTSLFVVSQEVGIGKTYTILQSMADAGLKHGEDWVYFSGYTTPLSLYEFLYQHKDKKVIVLDDIDICYKNNIILSFFKNATHSATGIRKLQYITTSKQREAPSEFEMKAGLVFVANQLPTNILIQALISRSLYYEIRITHAEKAKLIAEFAKIPYRTTTLEQRQDAFEFLQSNQPRALKEFSFRTIQKLYNIILQYKDKDEWRGVAKHILQFDELMQAFIEADKEATTKEAIARFKFITGASERTFYRLKRKYYGGLMI